MKVSKNKNSAWFIIILLLPYIPTYLSLINERIYQITIIYRVISFVIICGMYIFTRHRKLFASKFSVLALFYMGALFVSTVINQGSISKYFGYMVTCLGVLLIIDVYSKRNPDSLLTALVFVFRFMVYANFILMVLYPDGIYRTYDLYSSAVTRYNLLGLDNQTGPYFISLLTLSICGWYTKDKKIGLMGMIDVAICTISILYLWSATAVVGLIIFCLFLFMPSKFAKLVNLSNSYKVIGVAFLVFVVFQATIFLEPILQTLLKKDFTFTGRIYIWKEAISMIFKKPILGYGIQNSPNLVYFNIYKDYRTAHNEYLQIFINCGIVGITLILLQLKKVKRVISNQQNVDKCTKVLSAGIVSLLVMMLVDSYGQMMCFYIIIYYSYFRYNK